MRRNVSVCGEMAGDPAFTELLLAMGLRSFSMHPSQLASVKQRILRADSRRWAAALHEILQAESPEGRYMAVLQSMSAAKLYPAVLDQHSAV
jgi:phosphotransferase system enzyme I (PtsI)